MNALLIHDLTAAIERDAGDMSATECDEPFSGSWRRRRDAAVANPDEFLESVLEQLRLGPPSMRRR